MITSRAALQAALFVFCLLIIAPLLTALPAEAAMRRDTLTIKTQQTSHLFEIEIAETPDEQARGLMFRPKIPDGTGMLFPYGTPQEITMWMKNTYASLDMVFIRADGIIHSIAANTEPMSERVIGSGGPVTAVLELAAGTAAKLGIAPGDKVLHAVFGTAAK